jgi:hypothetical protein
MLCIRDKQGSVRALLPNAAQREFDKRAGKKNIVLKARQMGMTTWIAARFFVATITEPGTLSVQVAHDMRAAEEIFRIVHRFWANMPEWLRLHGLRTSRANVRQIVFPLLDSEYRVETAADVDAGRGLTIQNLHASEVARWPRDAAATLASLRAAVAPAGEIVLESTPDGASGCFYQEWQSAPETGYVRHFFPWWWEESYVRDGKGIEFTREEEELADQHDLSAGQIAFRREIKANFRKLAQQEFAEDAERCFLASGDCVFEVEKIDERLKRVEDWDRPEGEYTQFLPSRAGRTYIIGVDPAGGGSAGDHCCAEVIERSSGMQCAELHGRWTPHEFAHKLAELGRTYNQAVLAVETPGPGGEVMANLRNLGYHEVVEVRNTAASRPVMIGTLAAAVSGSVERFQSVRLLREMRSFVRRKDGSSGAAAGAHDDCVMAMAVALHERERKGVGIEDCTMTHLM